MSKESVSKKRRAPKLPLLVSYFYLRDQSERVVKEAVTNPNIELLVDSGAFSALNVGAEITLDEYMEFCHRWKKHLYGYLALDKLQDPKATDLNLRIMLREGLKPIPVHVFGDGQKRMDQLYGLSDWVALGGLRRPQRGPASLTYIKQKMDWAAGRKVHWLGYTRKAMLEAFRPFSCDCSSWASGMMFGRITFYFGNGVWMSFDRNQMFAKRIYDKPGFKAALAMYGIPLTDLLDERHWHNGNAKDGLDADDCVLSQLPARSWVRYVLEFKKLFGVRIFLAVNPHQQLPWMARAYDTVTPKMEF